MFTPSLVTRERELEYLISECTAEVYPETDGNKYKQTVRQLRARLSCDGDFVERSFEMSAEGFGALIHGSQFHKTMDVKSVSL